MKYVVLMLVALFISGCTSPTQRIAIQAIDRAVVIDAQIFDNMSDMIWQSALNISALKIEAAVAARDTAAAFAALEEFSDAAANVTYFTKMNERTSSLYRLTKQFIWARQGVLNLIWKELQEAKSRSDAKDIIKAPGG